MTCLTAQIMNFLKLFIYFLISHNISVIKGDRRIEEDIIYRIDWNSNFDVAYDSPILISTNLGEKYECDIPKGVDKKKKKEFDENFAVSEIELLNEVFSAEPCAVRTEFYWTYELCHKVHIRQYHEEAIPDKTTGVRQEYFLGYLDKSTSIPDPSKPVDPLSKKEPPKISLGEYAYPYFPMNFTSGDICDLTQQHRTTTVLYICFEELEAQIVEVAEIESCRYQVIFATRHLCRHPAYRRQHKTVDLIPCRPRNESPVKPLALVTLESEQRDLSSKGLSDLAALFEASGLGNIKIEAERKNNVVIYRIRNRDQVDQRAKVKETNDDDDNDDANEPDVEKEHHEEEEPEDDGN